MVHLRGRIADRPSVVNRVGKDNPLPPLGGLSPLAVQSYLKYDKLLRKAGLLLRFISLETLTGHLHDQLDEIGKADFKLVTIDSAQLIISAVKKAEAGNALIIRFYNSSARPVENATIMLGVDVKEGFLTNFNEENIEKLVPTDARSFALPVIKGNTVITTKFVVDVSGS